MKKVNNTEMVEVKVELGGGVVVTINAPKGQEEEFVRVLMATTTNTVSQTHCDNKQFRRWIMAQTFKMLNYKKVEWNRGVQKIVARGWDAYLREERDYYYQFKVMENEYKELSRFSKENDEEAMEERYTFFNRQVVIATYKDYLRKYKKNVNNRNYHHVELVEFYLGRLGETWLTATEVYSFIKHINASIKQNMELKPNTTKCSEWKDAYKGTGAYWTLKNMISFHDCVLPDCDNTTDSLRKLKSLLDTYFYNGEGWRFHKLLKETIEFNNFEFGNK